jgi:hypothetical protein
LLLLNASLCLSAGAQDTSQTPPPPPAQGGDFAPDNPQAEKIPTDVILVKGAMPSATDSSTPVPEGGAMNEKAYVNQYFGFSYALPPNWHEKYLGPPPSDSGYYVLAQIQPAKELQGAKVGTVLVSAQDLFFAHNRATSAQEMVSFRKATLGAGGTDYVLERPPSEVTIAGHTFYRMDYMSPAAELHWYTLTTEIRCHSVEFMMTSRDPALLDSLVQSIEKLKDAGLMPGTTKPAVPVCVKNYATTTNVTHRVDPILTDRKFNPIPVRLIIDRYGKVKHVHVVSAFPEQAKAITDALLQWEFKPYKRNGEPIEVETGIMFGKAQMPTRTATSAQD